MEPILYPLLRGDLVSQGQSSVCFSRDLNSYLLQRLFRYKHVKLCMHIFWSSIKNIYFVTTFTTFIVFSVGPRYVVQIGEKSIDYNEEFRLFLTTRNPNPEIPPDAFSIVTEVNFTTTRAGLKGQVGQ